MGSVMGRAPNPSRAGSRLRFAGALLLLLSMLAPLLTACEPDAKSAANANKTKLDTELRTASTVAGVPARRLDPIIAQENSLAANTSSGSNSAYQSAADGYTKLYNQVIALEKMTPSEAQAQASGDLSALQSSLATTESSGIADVVTAAKLFDPTVPEAQQRLAVAKTTKDFFAVDGYILDQSAAVTLILPDYQQIQALATLVNTQSAALAGKPGKAHVLQCATEGGEIPSYGLVPAQFWNPQSGYPIFASSPIMVTPKPPAQTYFFSSWPSQALAEFKAAQTADDFSSLNVELQAQVGTLTAAMDPATLQHYQIAATVARFQNDVNTYQAEAQANNDYLKSHRAKNRDVPDYISVWSLTNNPNGYAPPSDFYPNVPDFHVDPKYAQAAAQDVSALASAQSPSDLAALAKRVQQQEQSLAFPLVKVKAFYDTNITLRALIDQGQSTTTDVKYAGKLYKTPNAYEYADDDLRYDKKDTVGIQDAQIRLAQAAYREGRVATADTMADYQAIEDEAQMFIHNVSAMITNLAQMPKTNAARKAWSMTTHQTDLDLVNYYGLQNTRVIVVSLREQKARLYSNGKLVVKDGKPYAFDVTTGSPDKPTVPGIHCALPPLKGPPGGDLFKSPDPPGSPFYYQPTPVHYSFGYSLYGYYMHDGWWRDNTEMGYLTNLPHYDPAAFNGGSHGCINFHYSNGDMGKVYAFSSPGIPIVVY
ncbi:MAG TPA: L,D-transpeptidase [Ktedonobacterales bacterium]|nr:L,D-transpeptidase [Ktedonobacterales bacterium]